MNALNFFSICVIISSFFKVHSIHELREAIFCAQMYTFNSHAPNTSAITVSCPAKSKSQTLLKEAG